jgi:hypothetical protein
MSPEVLLENILTGGRIFFRWGSSSAKRSAASFPARSFLATSDRILRDSPPPLRTGNPGDISNVVRMGTFLS